jgi:hypothetical protein
MVNFPEQNPAALNQQFEKAGYGSRFFLQNIGSIAFFFALYPI